MALPPLLTDEWIDQLTGRQISSSGSRMVFKDNAERNPEFLLFQTYLTQVIRLQIIFLFVQMVKFLDYLSNKWNCCYIMSVLVFTVLKCALFYWA